jgi:hypothetical protein
MPASPQSVRERERAMPSADYLEDLNHPFKCVIQHCHTFVCAHLKCDRERGPPKGINDNDDDDDDEKLTRIK